MKAQDMYLGVLFSMEDLSVYGYMTNTKVKFITVLTVPDVIIKDLDMKNVSCFSQIGVCPLNPSNLKLIILLTPFIGLPSNPHSICEPYQQSVLRH